jgi:hypothetical protein
LGIISTEGKLAQQLNYDDIIDGFADAKTRKVIFEVSVTKYLFLLFKPEPIDFVLLVTRCGNTGRPE